jgi:hypothetical protein
LACAGQNGDVHHTHPPSKGPGAATLCVGIGPYGPPDTPTSGISRGMYLSRWLARHAVARACLHACIAVDARLPYDPRSSRVRHARPELPHDVPVSRGARKGGLPCRVLVAEGENLGVGMCHPGSKTRPYGIPHHMYMVDTSQWFRSRSYTGQTHSTHASKPRCGQR